jgi:hypothetical protein
MENKNIDRFERYLQNKMEEAEKKAFLQSLKEDEGLQRQFSAFIMSKEAVEKEVRNDLKQKMNAWKEPKDTGGKSWNVIIMIILVLLGIAAASVIWICPSQNANQWEQYAAVNLETLERSEDSQDVIRELNQYYINGNYAKAQQMIDAMPPTQRQQGEVQFIQGLLNYQSRDYEDALAIFDLLQKEDGLHFTISEQAEYFYALTLIRKDDCTAVCKKLLQRMANDPKHLRQREAKALLSEISL